jgi:hypothetical protein
LPFAVLLRRAPPQIVETIVQSRERIADRRHGKKSLPFGPLHEHGMPWSRTHDPSGRRLREWKRRGRDLAKWSHRERPIAGRSPVATVDNREPRSGGSDVQNAADAVLKNL